MKRTKRKIIFAVLLVFAVIAAFVLYRTVWKPQMVPQPGKYSAGDLLQDSGTSVPLSSLSSDSRVSDLGCDMLLVDDKTCKAAYLGGVDQTTYRMKRDLIYGDVLVVSLPGDKTAEFKILSDRSFKALTEYGFVRRGMVFHLMKE